MVVAPASDPCGCICLPTFPGLDARTFFLVTILVGCCASTHGAHRYLAVGQPEIAVVLRVASRAA